jgi:hypothetical protein
MGEPEADSRISISLPPGGPRILLIIGELLLLFQGLAPARPGNCDSPFEVSGTSAYGEFYIIIAIQISS